MLLVSGGRLSSLGTWISVQFVLGGIGASFIDIVLSNYTVF